METLEILHPSLVLLLTPAAFGLVAVLKRFLPGRALPPTAAIIGIIAGMMADVAAASHLTWWTPVLGFWLGLGAVGLHQLGRKLGEMME